MFSESCGFSSFGRARPCQGRGGGFEPRNPLHAFAVMCVPRIDLKVNATFPQDDVPALFWGVSSAGRASALQAEGHRFEPCTPHHFMFYGPVVQLVRTPACHAGGRGFEPHPDRHFFVKTAFIFFLFASVAQLVEQGTENPRVVGSIPTGGTT